MKKIIISSLFSCFLLVGFSQTKSEQENQCGTMQNLQRLKQENPALEQQIINYEQGIQLWLANNPDISARSVQTMITVPTVIHVVWNTAAENISNTICNQIIQALNEDYGRTNADTTLTPTPWLSIAANTGIQFCLAQRDPDGAPSTGIERVQTGITAFTTDDKVKFTSQGGADAWDPSRYFNIWICDLTPGLGGYGEFPTSSLSNTFGNVTDYQSVGTGEWVCTHESGHCFNLFHIWGDDGTSCSGSDLVSDTPNQAGPSSNTCPTFPATDACSPTSPGFMFMNYMDYGGNACKNLFTQGQSSRINAVLATAPYNSLAVSNGCVPVVLLADDAGAPDIITPVGMVCSTTIAPNIILRNWGTNNLTSCDINYKIDNNPVQTYTWNGSLVSLDTISVLLPSIPTTTGNHTFTCYTTVPNTVTDGNNTNDTAFSSFNVIIVGLPIPFSYGFEPTIFPPTGWTLDNPDASVSWARRAGVAYTGTASMWFNSINYTCNGCIDIITLPNLDLTTVTSPQLTFQVAYRMLSDPNQSQTWSDSLRVDVSTDCGQTWTNLYFKYSTNLTTIVPPFSTTAFVPGANNWRLETINLSSYAANNNVLLRFKVSSDYENNMYIDDINITGPTGIETQSQGAVLNVYPNPTTENVTIEYILPEGTNVQLLLFDALGKEILNQNEVMAQRGLNKIIIDESVFGGCGVYYIQIKTGNSILTKKVIKINQTN